MSQPHKLKVFNKAPGTLSTGFNTAVELDGKPLKKVTFLKFEVHPKRLTKVIIEILADVEVDIDGVDPTISEMSRDGMSQTRRK